MVKKIFLFKKSRKGVTPVIAVLLLLMMTVAAAGGAYVWISQLQDDFMERTSSEIDDWDREAGIEDLDCIEDTVSVRLRNSGDRTLSINPVDMLVYERASGERKDEYTRYGLNLFDVEDNDDELDVSVTDNSPHDDFASVGQVTHYDITVSENFEDATYYEVRFRFGDIGDYTISQSCRGVS